ncbi:MAG: serine protease, partial [Weeksellaceae bacterium]|nr:serine protease [Weeksellaceae bacterium]
LLLAVVLLNCIMSFGQRKVIFSEEFENNDNNWQVVHDKTEKAEIKLGKYLMENFTTNRWHWFSQSIDFDSKNNFLIEANISKLKSYNNNDNHGLMWGTADPKHCFAFVINTQNKYYSVFSIFDGNWFRLINWQTSNEINYGNATNKLGIAKIGKDLIFIINDEPVGTTPFQDFYGNHIGFYVGPKIKIAVDNLSVMNIESNLNSSSDRNSEWKGNGSGFFIDQRGYIATNYHVIKDANQIEINFIRNGQQQSFNAEVIQSDRQNDLAILKITDNSFNPFANIPYNFQTNLSDVGTNIFALGYPMADVMGSEIKFTDGKISSKTGIQGDITMYQISVPIQSGNSGGALFDYDGNLVGITSAGLNRDYFNSENVNYAIKTSYLKNLTDVLPISVKLPNDKTIASKTLTEKIKILSDYVVLIKIR